MKKKSICDVGIVLKTIKNISNEDYQNEIWIKHSNQKIIDSYDDTIMYFCEEGMAALKAKDANRISMTDKQYTMFKTLYNMIDTYDMSDDRPELDKDILNKIAHQHFL